MTQHLFQIPTPRLAFTVVRCGCSFVRRLSSARQPEQLVLVESAGSGIRVLTLNNDTQANCLSLAMISELHSAIKQVKDVKEVRAVVIRGTGRFFSCGHDLNEFVGNDDSELPATVFTACANLMIDLANLPVPSIASVGGFAHGTGCQLVATCDMAVAGQSAKFVAAPIRLGLFGSTPGVALVRAIGMRATKELLFTAPSLGLLFGAIRGSKKVWKGCCIRVCSLVVN
ncbi:Enoyl-CoA hydratase domain-containing protein 3, mitochondrial [Clonorchis sinensis]|uniref:Enoyl-CoA hydratase domain-containing protein 3, mitochondrial n=1 Tax=Clonorchis sinensis TaxID=79923 RepID=A0A8T1MKB1_CLOSI|nr:Enoyl-CoA hydratase domain-containing protein 3, mitochondrial [Clonorchis sinensis]